jgi:hypothetical protein
MGTTIQLATLLVKIAADSKEYERQMTEAQKKSQQLAQGMQNIGKGLTVGVTVPLVAVGAAGVKAASDLGESWSKANVVFGDSSSTIDKFAATSASAFGVSKRAAYEATGTFGNLFTTMGLGRSASADMSVGLVQLAADQASFNNLDSADVLEKFRSGLVGQTEPLRALGINLTADSVQAKAMQMGLADANGELSQGALVQARYALIVEQSTNAAGDFARTSDGLANSTRIAQAQFENAAAALGQSLLPYVTKGAQVAAQMAESFTKLDPRIQATVVGFGAIAAATGPVLMGVGKAISLYNTLSVSLKAANLSMGTMAVTAGAVAAAVIAVTAAAAKWNDVNNQVKSGVADTNSKWKSFFDTQISKGKNAQEVMEAYRAKEAELNAIMRDSGLIAQVWINSQGGVTASTEDLTRALARASTTSDEYLLAMVDSVSKTGYLTDAEREAALAIYESVKAEDAANSAITSTTTAIDARGAAVQTTTSMLDYQRNSWAAYQDTITATNVVTEHAKLRQEELQTISVALAASIDGPLAGAYTNYSTQMTDLTTKNTELQAEIDKLILQGYTPNGEKVTALTQQMADNKIAMDAAKVAIDEQTKSILYQKVASELDAEAALNLGRQWGLVSETDYNVAIATQAATDAFDLNHDGTVSAAEAATGFYKSMDDLNGMLADGVLTTKELNDWLDKLNGKTVTSYAYVETRTAAGGGKVGGSANTKDDGKAIAQASGGDWQVNKPTLFMAGEAGPERAIFIPQGKDAPADMRSGNTYNIYGEFRADSPQRLSDELRLMEMLQ